VRKKRASAGARGRGRPQLLAYGCAFCGEENEVFVDPSGERRQTFTEDCTVCCRPNLIALTVNDGGDVDLHVTQEYEA
jgi:hypothetical protein